MNGFDKVKKLTITKCQQNRLTKFTLNDSVTLLINFNDTLRADIYGRTSKLNAVK